MPVPCSSNLFPTRKSSNTACRSVGVKRECRSGVQLCSASVMSCRHSSIDRWVRQFHGLEDETGWAGIMERKMGDDTGVAERLDLPPWLLLLRVLAREARGVERRSGDGGLPRRLGVAGADCGKVSSFCRKERKGFLASNRVSTRAPAWSSSRNTSLLPRATAT